MRKGGRGEGQFEGRENERGKVGGKGRGGRGNEDGERRRTWRG
jgi:hypothetical protein